MPSKHLDSRNENDRQRLAVDDVKDAAPGSVTFVDVRKKPDRFQIRGSVRYDSQKLLAADKLTLPLPREGRIVVYCGSGNSSGEVAQRLREQGYHNAAALEGGYEAWKNADLPLEELSQEQPIPGQDDAGIGLL